MTNQERVQEAREGKRFSEPAPERGVGFRRTYGYDAGLYSIYYS